jgi:hypothetical protein
VILPIRIMAGLVFALLAGCCQQKGWVFQKVISDYPQFDSAQLIYVPDNRFSGVAVQLLQGEFGTVGFLNAYSRMLVSNRVVIQVGECFYSYLGTLLEGGQKLLLPQEATVLLVQTLLSGQKSIVYLDGFSTELCPP